jgi:hypothetical protein
MLGVVKKTDLVAILSDRAIAVDRASSASPARDSHRSDVDAVWDRHPRFVVPRSRALVVAGESAERGHAVDVHAERGHDQEEGNDKRTQHG